MARPVDLHTFVFAKLPAQAQKYFPDLPDLPEVPGGGDNLPAVQFPEPALNAFADLPIQANLPDWLI